MCFHIPNIRDGDCLELLGTIATMPVAMAMPMAMSLWQQAMTLSCVTHAPQGAPRLPTLTCLSILAEAPSFICGRNQSSCSPQA